MKREVLIIQAQVFHESEQWFDLTTFGDTLEDVREELKIIKDHNPYNCRIIKRVTTTEDFIIE